VSLINEYRAFVESYWQGKTEVLGTEPLPVPFCLLRVLHGLRLRMNPGFSFEKLATNRLSHGTAPFIIKNEIRECYEGLTRWGRACACVCVRAGLT